MANLPLADLEAFAAVAESRSFRKAAALRAVSASALSEAVRRLEARLDSRLLNRTTRSVTPTEAGRLLLERIVPMLGEISGALDQVKSSQDSPAGRLRLNVPTIVARHILPGIAVPFLRAHPGITLEVEGRDTFIDVFAEGFDAGIRYDESLELVMIAVPIGPRVQRFASAASPAYLNAHGRPQHPRDLLSHACIRGRFAGRPVIEWEFEHDGEVVKLDPPGPLVIEAGGGMELGVAAAIAGTGVIKLFEDWLRPHFESGALEPVLEPWWQSFSGPFLYYPGRRLVPAPLRAFIDFAKAMS
mgnify:CR=1 FL=1